MVRDFMDLIKKHWAKIFVAIAVLGLSIVLWVCGGFLTFLSTIVAGLVIGLCSSFAITYLFENGRLETTVYRAKEVRALADKMITLGKKNTLASKRQALAFITKEEVVVKLFNEIAPSYADRNGGYTRVLKIGPRRGDGAEMAIIELVK